MSRTTAPCTLAALASLSIALVACGGGGGGTSVDSAQLDPLPAPAPTPEPAPAPPVTVSGVVADGPLSGVLVCYDLNSNGRCEADEPSAAPTDADGRYSLRIDPALAGQHQVLAEVPATAIDKDTGAAVGRAYTLVAPASGVAGNQTVFVSPLTTLVERQLEAIGRPLAEVVEFIRSQTGLGMSPLDDFSSSPSADARQAATLARLVQLTVFEQAAELAGVIGTADLSGANISPADVDRVATSAALGALPAISVVAQAVVDAGPPSAAERDLPLVTLARALVNEHTGMDANKARTVIGLAKLPKDTTADAPEASANLTAFRFVDADNWVFRAFLSNASDSTPDADGLRYSREQRSLRQAGQTITWGYGASADRAGDLHWTGTEWASCYAGERIAASPTDSAGRSSYRYCGAFEQGSRVRTVVDVGGRSLRSVVETVRSFPGATAGVNYADWGPADLALLGSTALPVGSALIYQTNTPLNTAVTYDPRPTNTAGGYPAAVAAGGDARSNAGVACNVTAAQAALLYAAYSSLDELMARSPGQACRFNPGSNANGSSGERNEWWNSSTASLGILTDVQAPPTGTGTYYTRNLALRVAFVPGSTQVNYYKCLQRSDGSARNCEPMGSGSYSVDSLGDARTLRFKGLPPVALRLGYSRVFVERGGKVYLGFQLPTGQATATARLNLTAANTLFTQLGLPLLAP